MAAFKDITGQRFGRLLVLRRAGLKNHNFQWECACDCGAVRIVDGGNLRSGRTRGCSKHYPKTRPRKVPAKGRPKDYGIWWRMVERCRNPKSRDFPAYGGRGITVCERWQKFVNFTADMGPRPAGLSIDRIDNNKGYEPDNCRWATPTEQANNTRSNRILTAFGKSMTIAQWERELGLAPGILDQRIRVLRWPTEKALTTPRREWGPNRPKLLS
jgi:hypothetical protein